MKVAVVGNRKGWTYQRVHDFLDEKEVHSCELIISGGAEGVDTFAQEYAKDHAVPILILYPDMSKKSPERYYERNRKIAEQCDVMIAFDRNPGKTGTTNARHQTTDLGKRVIHVVK